MNPLSYLYMSARNMVDLLSGKSLKNSGLSVYKPNKGRINIFFDHLRDIISGGAIERGYWMYGFQNISRKEQREYIPYSDFMRKRNRLNMHPNVTYTTNEKFNYLCILRDKFIFGRVLSQLGFPVAKDIMLIDGKNNIIRKIGEDYNSEPLENILHYNFDAFCKVVSGECGKGVFKIKCEEKTLYGEVTSLHELKEVIGDSLCVLQNRLCQHEVLNMIYPKSINTMRLITCRKENGTVNALPAVLRFGANGNTVDNWAAGGLIVGINAQGTLFGKGYYEFPIGDKIDSKEHPDTKIKFDGINVPFYEEAVKMAKELHSCLYGIPCIGWDIAFSPTGPVFIEGNDNFEITLNQRAHGGLKKVWLQSIE